MAVGVYVAANDAAYFEVFPIANLQRTMSVIGTSLLVGATVTALAAAGLGWWASRRLLSPLSRVADAASEIAEGGLDTRLPEETDPDLDRLVSSFNDMADAVQARIEREARFASDVSHELRSPITALTAAVEVLDARRDDLPDRSQQALDVVISQVRRFDQMVLDLLEISRLDAGATEFNPEPVLLGDLVRRIAARYGFDSVPVEVDHRGPTARSPVDKRRLERIVANLLDNAQQHGGGPVRIASTTAATARVNLVVEDAGPGVSPVRAHPHLRALRPRHRGPPPGRHRASASPSSPSTPPSTAVRRGWRTAPAAAPASSSRSRRDDGALRTRPAAGRRRAAGGRRGRSARWRWRPAGCPTTGTYTAIRPDDLPVGLADTTTTSTTTTTLPPATTTTAPEATTTTTTIPTQPVSVYYVAERPAAAGRAAVPAAGLAQTVADNLDAGPLPSEQAAGLRSALPAELARHRHRDRRCGHRRPRSRVRDADPSTEQLPVPNVDQPLAFGQIVLSLTSLPGIGQVRFTVGSSRRARWRPTGR